jgi:hypothetical protein
MDPDALGRTPLDPTDVGPEQDLNPHFHFERRTDQTKIAQHPQEARLSAAPR